VAGWPTHLITERPERADTRPLSDPNPRFTACGIRVYGQTWRGYDTVPGGTTVAGSRHPGDVDCKKCIRTKRYATALKE
jgi:hypothetical protein